MNSTKYAHELCSTPYPGYVPRCVSQNLSTVLIQFSSGICFWVVITYVTVYRIWILRPRVSPDLDRELDIGIPPNLTFLVVRFDRFQFQTLFSNILDFS